jgi:ribosomal protein S18 acetylase RimI-like enzyme
MDDVLIRQAKETDLPVIVQLQQEWANEDIAYGYVTDGPQQIRDRLGEYFLVAETADNVVGFIGGSVRIASHMAVVPDGNRYLEIDDLYVSAPFRRRGIGDLLVEQLLAQAGRQGAGYAVLYSATKDTRTVLRFYERHQFKSWYVQMFRNL